MLLFSNLFHSSLIDHLLTTLISQTLLLTILLWVPVILVAPIIYLLIWQIHYYQQWVSSVLHTNTMITVASLCIMQQCHSFENKLLWIQNCFKTNDFVLPLPLCNVNLLMDIRAAHNPHLIYQKNYNISKTYWNVLKQTFSVFQYISALCTFSDTVGNRFT